MERINPTRLVHGAASIRDGLFRGDHDPGSPDDGERDQANDREADAQRRCE